MLVYAIFDALQGNLSRHAQRIALENIFAPLDTVLLNVNKQLLYQHSLIVKFLFLFGQHRGIKLDLRIHFFFRVIKGGWLLSNTTQGRSVLVNLGFPSRHPGEELVGLGDFVNCRQLNLDRANFMTQLLIAQIARLLVRLNFVVCRDNLGDRLSLDILPDRTSLLN